MVKYLKAQVGYIKPCSFTGYNCMGTLSRCVR